MAVQPAHPWAVNKEIIELTQKSRVPTIHETLTGGGGVSFRVITAAISESL